MEEKEPVTIDTIIEYLEESVKTRKVLDAGEWLKYGQMMNVLLSKEHDQLFMLEQLLAKKRLQLLEAGEVSVSEAKLRVEALDEYRQSRSLKAKIGRVEEMIRLAKRQAALKDSEYRNQ